MQVFPEAQQCPVCKAAVSENLVRPRPQERPSIPKSIPQRHPKSDLRLKIPALTLRPLLPFPQVIPLYGRGSCEHPRGKQMLGMDVPTRPPGLRLLARNTNANEAGGGEWGLAGAGVAENVGLMSTLLGFGIQFGTGVRSSLLIDNMSPEQQQQAFLSQLLLLLGSFVILCLLIF